MSYHPDEPADVYLGTPRPSKSGIRSRLKDRGLERPNRPNGVKMSDSAVESICKDGGAEYTRTPAGRLWVTCWAIVVIGALEGYRRAERVRAVQFFGAPEREELRAALVALWRMKRRDAVREMVEHAGFGGGKDRFATYQRRAAGRARHLTDQGFIAARGKVLETLQTWGWRGRERWTDWALMKSTPEPQVWFPLWVVQILLWCAPMLDLASVSRRGFEHDDAMAKRLLHALAHDPETRAAALTVARTGQEPVLEFLRQYDERVRRCRYVAGF